MKYISGSKNLGILKDGNYPYEITSARPAKSKRGSDVIEITLDVGGNGKSVKIKDWLVFDGGQFTSARIDQLRASIGEVILPEEEIDVQPGDLLHKTGMCHVIVEGWNGRDRNKIGSYLEPQDEIPGLKPEGKNKEKSAKQPW